jgi:SNF2 family DNA or RNA helicase
MYSVAFRVRSKDVLDLPPVQYLTRTCTLTKEGAAVYRNLEKEMQAQVKEGSITAGNALVKLLRLRQITGGFVRNDDHVDMDVDTSKRELLEDTLEDIAVSEPVVVFAQFQHDLDVIQAVTEASGLENHKRAYFELSGRRDEVEEFKAACAQAAEQGEKAVAPVIGVQIQAGGAGIDLTAARYCLYFSSGFSLGDYDQSLARVYRPGQKRSTYFISLIAEGTVDVKVQNVLEGRRQLIDSIMAENPGMDESEAKRQANQRLEKSLAQELLAGLGKGSVDDDEVETCPKCKMFYHACTCNGDSRD